MKQIVFIVFLITGTMLFSCENEKENNPFLSKNNLIIKTGTVCGWCGGVDSLTISESELKYIYYSPCDENDIDENGSLNKEEWQELKNSFNWEDFLNIDINTCNVCVDGCDTWISIENDTIQHEIRYGYGDSLTVQSINLLIEKLDKIKSRYRN